MSSEFPWKCKEFQWDDGNFLKNWEKHKVSTNECEQVFFNHPLVCISDDKHSATEVRYHLLGITDLGRKLLIVFTVRNQKIRVISARDMSKKERKVYEEKTKENTDI